MDGIAFKRFYSVYMTHGLLRISDDLGSDKAVPLVMADHDGGF